jgi:hypothetical protein
MANLERDRGTSGVGKVEALRERSPTTPTACAPRSSCAAGRVNADVIGSVVPISRDHERRDGSLVEDDGLEGHASKSTPPAVGPSDPTVLMRRHGIDQKKTPDVRPGAASKKFRHVADPVLLDFLSQEKPPTSPDLRLGIVKLALADIASRRGHDRLAGVLHHGDENVVKAIYLAASHVQEGAVAWLLQDDEPDYKRALKLLGTVVSERPQVDEFSRESCVIFDKTMLRIIETAGDVLDWDSEDDSTYVTSAWPVLADEYEWEREGGDDPWNRVRAADRLDDRTWSGPATRSELVALEHEDLRYERCDSPISAVPFRS